MRENDRQKADENQKRYDDMLKRLRATLDRTHLSSVSRKPLEKALQKLLSQGPAAFDELKEDDDE